MTGNVDRPDPSFRPWRGWPMWALGAAYFGYDRVHRVSLSVMTPYPMRNFAIAARARTLERLKVNPVRSGT
jgi:hypothetical protein